MRTREKPGSLYNVKPSRLSLYNFVINIYLLKLNGVATTNRQNWSNLMIKKIVANELHYRLAAYTVTSQNKLFESISLAVVKLSKYLMYTFNVFMICF